MDSGLEPPASALSASKASLLHHKQPSIIWQGVPFSASALCWRDTAACTHRLCSTTITMCVGKRATQECDDAPYSRPSGLAITARALKKRRQT